MKFVTSLCCITSLLVAIAAILSWSELGGVARSSLATAALATGVSAWLAARLTARPAAGELRLQRLIGSNGQGIWDWDIAAGKVVFSGHWASMLGYRLDEIEHSYATWERLLHPEDRPHALTALQAHLSGASPHYEVEHRMLTADGKWKWIFTRGVIVERDAQGHAIHLTGTHTDIDQRKLAEEGHRRQETLLRQLSDNLPEGALYQFVVGRDGKKRNTFAGEGFKRILGIENRQLLDRPGWMRQHILPEDTARVVALSEKSIAARLPFRYECRARTTGGEIKWLSFRSHPREGPDGEVIWDGIMLDVTRQKEAENEVARQIDFHSALNQTTIDLLNRREKEPLLQTIVERTARLLDTPHVELAFLEGDELVTRAYAGPFKQTLGDRATRQVAPMSWRALDSGLPVIVDDYASETGNRPLYVDMGSRAAAVFPILHGERRLGILGLIRHRPGHVFNLDDLQKGQLLARLVTLVLHNSAIYEDALRVAEARTSALRDSEWRLREAQRIAHIGHWEYSFADGHNSGRWSDEAFRIHGLEPQSVAIDRAQFDRLIHPQDLSAIREEIAAVWQNPRQIVLNYRIIRPDGTIRHIHDEGEPKRDAQGRVIGMQGIVQDVTERTIAETELRDREERFRSVFDLSPIPVVLASVPEGRIVAANAAAMQTFGYSLAESIGRTTLELGIWEDPAARDAFLRLLQERGSVTGHEVRMRNRRGESLRMLYSGSVISLAGKVYSLSSLLDVTAQKRAEDSHRESELRFKRVVENIGDALMVDDADGRIVFANDRFLEMFRFTRAELEGRTIFDHMRPEDIGQTRARHRARLAGRNVPALFETEAVRADGSRFWIELRVTPVHENGRIIGTQAAVRDITERRLIDQTLRLLSTGAARLSGERFFDYVALRLAELLGGETGVIATFIPGPRTIVRSVGLSIDGQPARHEQPLADGTLAAAVLRARVSLFASAAAQAFPGDELIRRCGAAACAAVPLFGSTGEIVGFVAVLGRQELPALAQVESVLQLASVRLVAELARMRNERQFQDFFEFAPDAIVLLDPAGRIARVNHRAEKLFGQRGEELIGQPIGRLAADAGRTLLPILRGLRPGAGAQWRQPVNLQARRSDGTLFAAQISLGAVETDTGVLVAAAVRDISEQQLAESHLRQRQKIEALGTLAGGIAHDFNNILTGMFGFVELSRAELPPGHPAAHWLENIATAGRRARNLVQQILTFSRQNEGPREPVDVSAVTREALRLIRSTLPPMVRIEPQLAENAPPVLADATQLHQVVMNLCTNSWQALPESGGVISVSVEPLVISDEAAAGRGEMPRGRAVKLTVADNGSGIPPAIMERIFDPFFTTKPAGQGTGLGLAVVHGVVRAHGCEIAVRSAPGEGTRIEIFLPAIESVAGRERAAAPLPRGHGEKVLLIDDESIGRTALAALIGHLGYSVEHFEHPQAAVTQFASQAADYAAVITDFAMPDMTGAALARQVRHIRPDIPVLVISGFIDPDQQAKLEQAGVMHLLRKPPTLEELAHAIARCLQPASPGI
ncbi:MAG: hypothetical protein C0502_02320 [Opitutus sp.]|nr:hypothetical protein [Opitutus sp.]